MTQYVDLPEGRYSVMQAAKLRRINYWTVRRRYDRGDRGERLFRPPEQKYNRRGRWEHK